MGGGYIVILGPCDHHQIHGLLMDGGGGNTEYWRDGINREQRGDTLQWSAQGRGRGQSCLSRCRFSHCRVVSGVCTVRRGGIIDTILFLLTKACQ